MTPARSQQLQQPRSSPPSPPTPRKASSTVTGLIEENDLSPPTLKAHRRETASCASGAHAALHVASPRTSEPTTKIADFDVSVANQHLLETSCDEDWEGHEGVVLCDAFPLAKFEDLDLPSTTEIVPNSDGKTGAILIYELPSQRHDATAIQISQRVRDQVAPHVTGEGGSFRVIPGGQKYADSALKPNNRHTAGPVNHNGLEFPTLVVEVANSQSIKSARIKAMQWIGAATTVQECWVVKLFNTPPKPGVRAEFSRYVRAIGGVDPKFDRLNFGTHGVRGAPLVAPPPRCHAAGVVEFQVPLPAAHLFHGVAPVPAGVPIIPAAVCAFHGLAIGTQGVTLDLYGLQQFLLSPECAFP